MRRRLQGIIAAVVGLLSGGAEASDVAVVTIIPEADAFVRSAAPASNYGGAGAIAVSGSAAVNATNQQNGLYESLIRFPMNNVVARLDEALATHDWLILGVTLSLTEFGAPPSPIFNRGVGAFEVRWIVADAWVEGTGIPATPTTNGVTWNDVPGLLNPAVDVALGQFTNTGVDGRLTFSLSPAQPFVTDMRSGGPVNLYLKAATPEIGFTANSRSFPSTNDVPVLSIVAAVNPNVRIDSIGLTGIGLMVGFKTVSNWSYALEGSGTLEGIWTNVTTIGAQPTNGARTVADGLIGPRKFYRLSATR